VQVLLCRGAEWDCQDQLATRRSSYCASEAPNKQTRQSTSSGLLVVVGHSEGRHWVPDLDHMVDLAAAASHLVPYPSWVVLVLLAHWANHFDLRSLCSLVAAQALEGRLQAFRGCHWNIAHSDQAGNDFVVPAAEIVVEGEHLWHCSFDSNRVSKHQEIGGCLSSRLFDACCLFLVSRRS
jgi:hypothetical protein